MSGNGSENMYSKITKEFKKEVIRESLKTQYANSKNKITEEAVELINEILHVLVVETAIRAAKQATEENKTSVGLDHLENVLPQIMLDFP